MTSRQMQLSMSQAEAVLGRARNGNTGRFERTTAKIPVVSMREMFYGTQQPRPAPAAPAPRHLVSVSQAQSSSRSRRFMTVAEMKARIDPEQLRLTRARLRKSETRRMVKNGAKAVGSFMLCAGVVLGLGAGVTSVVRRELRK